MQKKSWRNERSEVIPKRHIESDRLGGYGQGKSFTPDLPYVRDKRRERVGNELLEQDEVPLHAPSSVSTLAKMDAVHGFRRLQALHRSRKQLLESHFKHRILSFTHYDILSIWRSTNAPQRLNSVRGGHLLSSLRIP